MRILVTGATGFLGQNLVPRLIQLGHNVRTFGRNSVLPSTISDLKIEHIQGDITDEKQIIPTVKNCDIVFHLAGLVSYKKKDWEKQYAVNVLGTRNVMRACHIANVNRVIHTSSVAAMGIPKPGEIGSEDIKYNLTGLGLSYCDTKHQAELEVMKAVEDGLNAVILNPGIILGVGDTHPHHHAIFAAMSKGWMIGVPPGGVTFSDINDVVDAHLSCIKNGKVGERYILVSVNLSFKEAALTFARLNGVSGPLFEIPGGFLVALGTLAENILPIFGIRPPLTRQVAWLSQYDIFFSSAKACAELAFHQTPFEETVRRIAPYYLNNLNKALHQ